MIQERRNYQPLVTRPEQRAFVHLCESCLVSVVNFIGARCPRCQRKHEATMRNVGWICWVAILLISIYLLFILARN